MEAKVIFGSNVRRIRKSIGLSQEKLAEKIGIHRTYIGSIERGERNVSLNNIVAIAQALDTSISDLFDGIKVTSSKH